MHTLTAQLMDLLQRREIEMVIAAIFYCYKERQDMVGRAGADRRTHWLCE